MLSDGTLVTDAQIHVWPEQQRDDPDALGKSRRALVVADILQEMDTAGVDHAVLVPPSAAGDDNSTALDAAARFPDRFAVMGRVPLAGQDFSASLGISAGMRAWRDQPGMFGVRLTFTSPAARMWLRDGTADRFWPMAEEHGIPVMVASGHDIATMEQLLVRYPGLRLAIDHMGLETSDRDEAIKLAVDRLVPMARYENLCVKASAVPTYLAEYPLTWAMPHVSRLVDAFGPHRVFWGSDLSRLDIPYRELVDGFADGLRLTAPDRALVMGGALRAWLGWSPSPPSSTGAGAAQP